MTEFILFPRGKCVWCFSQNRFETSSCLSWIMCGMENIIILTPPYIRPSHFPSSYSLYLQYITLYCYLTLYSFTHSAFISFWSSTFFSLLPPLSCYPQFVFGEYILQYFLVSLFSDFKKKTLGSVHSRHFFLYHLLQKYLSINSWPAIWLWNAIF